MTIRRNVSRGSRARRPRAASQARLLIPPKSPKKPTLEIDGHRLKFTNLNKIFYPDEGITKRDLLNYYDAVANLILPHLKDRPLSLKRYPNGIQQEFFFQKEGADEVSPPWLRTEPIVPSTTTRIHYVIGDDRATLLYLANLGCIDHNPWMSRSARSTIRISS